MYCSQKVKKNEWFGSLDPTSCAVKLQLSDDLMHHNQFGSTAPSVMFDTVIQPLWLNYDGPTGVTRAELRNAHAPEMFDG